MHGRFADTTECHTVQGQLAESVKVSIQIPDHDGSDDFLQDVKAKFQKKACTILDKMLYKDLKPFHTQTIDNQWKGNTVQCHMGFATVPMELVEQAYKKSGHLGIFIRAVGREPFDMVRLPNADTLAMAKAKASKIAGMAYGVIPTHTGYAIRCKPCEKVAMEKALMPEYTDAVGDDLLEMPRNEEFRILLMGVPREMSELELINQTTMGSWKCRPIGQGPKCTVYGKKNVLAVAKTLPPKEMLRLRLGNSNEYHIDTSERRSTIQAAVVQRLGLGRQRRQDS